MVKKNNFIESLNLFNNKSGKKSYNGILIIAGILGVMALMGVVFAFASGTVAQDAGSIHIYNASGSQNEVAANPNLTIASEGTQFYFFVNVSNAEAAQSGVGTALTNITNVTISFDREFIILQSNFSKGDIAGDANGGGNGTFKNRTEFGNNFFWSNVTSDLINSTTGNGTFEFSAIVSVPGTYNITVRFGNDTATGGVSTTNVTYIFINDSTAPYNISTYSNSTGHSGITPVYRSYPATRANISNFAIYVELNARDFYEIGAGGVAYNGQLISTVNFTLYNGTAGVMNSTLITRNGAINDSFAINFTSHKGGNNLSDDHYYVNVTTVNDSKGNINYTGLGFNITVDRTVPSITAAKASSSTSKQIVLDLTITDTTSGIAGKQCTATGGGTEGITMSGVTGTQTATQTGLGCSTAYTYTINCVDHSGNTGSKEVTVSTDTCSGGGSSGGTGGGGTEGEGTVGSATSPFWILTYNEASTDLSDIVDGVSNKLAERYRVKVKVDTKLYYVGVVDTTDTTAKINVTTTAEDKEATLSVGDVKKFDVNADDKYDLSITLNGVDSATGKADLSVIYVQEPVSAEDREAVEEQVGEEEVAPTEGKSKTWIWIVVVLAVLVIIGAIFYSKKKTRFKNYGF